MAGKGGVRSTSFQPKWKLGETKAIRVPAVLVDKILTLARALDEGKDVIACYGIVKAINEAVDLVSFGAVEEVKRQIILQALDRYVESQQSGSGSNQHRKKGEPVDIENSRDWKHLLKFKKEIEGEC